METYSIIYLRKPENGRGSQCKCKALGNKFQSVFWCLLSSKNF